MVAMVVSRSPTGRPAHALEQIDERLLPFGQGHFPHAFFG
jgi:hypothetical protein